MISVRRKFFASFAKWLFFVFVLNALASYFYWYSSIKEFDLGMHFLGGFTAALFSFWFFYKKCVLWIESDNKGKLFRVILLSVLLIALAWEAMEFIVQDLFNVTILASVPDSMSDVALGLLGGIVAHHYLLRKYRKERAKMPLPL